MVLLQPAPSLIRRRWKRRWKASLELAQVVVERLDVGEDAHGVRFTTHDHHVLHLDEPVAAGLLPAEPQEDKSGDSGAGSPC